MTINCYTEAIPLPLLVNPCVFIHKLGIQNSLYPHCTVVPGQLIAAAPWFITAGYSKNSTLQTILYCLLIIYICPMSLALFKPRLSFKNNPNIYCPLKILYFFTQLLSSGFWIGSPCPPSLRHTTCNLEHSFMVNGLLDCYC